MQVSHTTASERETWTRDRETFDRETFLGLNSWPRNLSRFLRQTEKPFSVSRSRLETEKPKTKTQKTMEFCFLDGVNNNNNIRIMVNVTINQIDRLVFEYNKWFSNTLWIMISEAFRWESCTRGENKSLVVGRWRFQQQHHQKHHPHATINQNRRREPKSNNFYKLIVP